jgi:hypothetical protein
MAILRLGRGYLAENIRSPIKEPPLRLPGQSSVAYHNQLREDRILFPIVLATVFAALAATEWTRYFYPSPPHPWLYTVIALGVIGYAAWRVLRVMPELRQLRQAIDGERAVGQCAAAGGHMREAARYSQSPAR